jgi:Zn-dependent protease
MFGRAWKIATIRGIPVNVDSSWIWIAVLAVWNLSSQFSTYPGVSEGAAFGFGALAALLFFGSVFLHELAHAVAARLAGIRVNGITLVFFGGFTSARSEERGPGPAFRIAAVGPGTSLVLGAAFWALERAVARSAEPLPAALGAVAWVNLFMAVFNVLPGLPLDGGRMLQAIWWRVTGDDARATRAAARSGMVVGAALIGGALFAISRNELYGAVWLGLIGVFIFQGARGSERRAGFAKRLAGATVADAMEPPPPAVPAEITLSEALDRYLRGHETEAFPVVHGDRVIGMISFSSAREVGAVDPLRLVRDATIPLDRVLVADPAESLERLIARLGTERAALVLSDGRLVGAITGSALERYVMRGT